MAQRYSTTKRRHGQGTDWEILADDVIGGVKSGAWHGFWYFKNKVETIVFFPALHAIGYKVAGGPVAQRGLKVVGVGYGRTGTYSVRLALEELGFPTLHTQHLYENNEIFDMWMSSIIDPSIKADEIILGTPDFDLMARKGYVGTMDFPAALYYEQIMDKYPDCKFILTTRDDSDQWFRSWQTLARTITEPTRYWQFMAHVRQYNDYLRWLFSVVNKDAKYLSCAMPFPDQDKKAAISGYEEHNRRVRELIPSDRLLEYSVKEGWGPLCDFLDIKSCPITPFPKSNSARSLQIQTISAMAIPLTLTLFVVFYAFTCMVHRLTGQTVLGWMGSKRVQVLRYLSGQQDKARRKRAAATAAAKKQKKRC